jgi:AcrR family transcriptional regulator
VDERNARITRGRKRSVAGRDQILDSARTIGVRDGWRAVTIRAVARELGYSSPLLYEHFRNKEDLLTRIAVEGLVLLEAKLTENLPANSRTAVLVMVERYWTFMLENTQLYRLMNGMDGVPIDKEAVNGSAQSVFKVVAAVVRRLAGKKATETDAQILVDELWALLHGMATLHLDRSVPFDPERVATAAWRLITGARRIGHWRR